MKFIYAANIRLPTEKAHGYQIMKTCGAVARGGADVTLVVADRKNPLAGVDPFDRYGVPERFELVRLPVIDALMSVPAFLQKPAFLLEQATFLRSLRTWMGGPRARVWYMRSPSIAKTVLRATGEDVFIELHALPSPRKLRGLENVRGFVCLTSWLAAQMHARFPRIPTTVIPDAVDVEIFDPPMSRADARRALDLAPSDEIVAYGGRFTTLAEGKGLGQLDAAIHAISTSRPRLRLLLIGGTADEFTRIEGRAPSPTTTCIDLQPRERLAQYYRAADVLVMPFPDTPHYAHEMSPLKMFEYMASRTAILTTDLPSVRDVLDERSAAFAMPDDSASLQIQLQRLLDDPALRESLAGQARSAVEAYTWDARAAKIRAFITANVRT